MTGLTASHPEKKPLTSQLGSTPRPDPKKTESTRSPPPCKLANGLLDRIYQAGRRVFFLSRQKAYKLTVETPCFSFPNLAQFLSIDWGCFFYEGHFDPLCLLYQRNCFAPSPQKPTISGRNCTYLEDPGILKNEISLMIPNLYFGGKWLKITPFHQLPTCSVPRWFQTHLPRFDHGHRVWTFRSECRRRKGEFGVFFGEEFWALK